MKIDLIKTSSPRRTRLKYKNARVSVMSLDNEKYGINFKLLDTETAHIPKTAHINLKDKVVITALKLSTEGALSLYLGLQEQLKANGIVL